MTISKEWRARMAADQQVKTIKLGGVTFARIPHADAAGDPCNDCAVEVGQLHTTNCDRDLCPHCKVGQLAFGCACLGTH